MGDQGYGLHPPTVERIASEVKSVVDLGSEVCMVIGGGNTAVEEALFLTNFASKVTLIHRRDSLRADKVLQDRLFRNPRVEVIWNHEVDEVLGTEAPLGVTGVRLKSVIDGSTQVVEADGVADLRGIAHASTVS